MLHVLTVKFDATADALLPRAAGELRAHLARMRKFHARGSLLMSGSYRAPSQPLATMGIFTSRAAAEEFAAGDPFVVNGLAREWGIREWHDILAAPQRDSGDPA